jgi:hypothetical protein
MSRAVSGDAALLVRVTTAADQAPDNIQVSNHHAVSLRMSNLPPTGVSLGLMAATAFGFFTRSSPLVDPQTPVVENS